MTKIVFAEIPVLFLPFFCKKNTLLKEELFFAASLTYFWRHLAALILFLSALEYLMLR